VPEPYAAGAALRVREVLHGAEWASWDERVVSDDGILVSVQADGTPMAFPEHPVPHPWGHLDAWRGTTVLKMRREGDWYSVWRFFDADGAFVGWYVNFETPVVRTDDGIEVNDLQLDIVIAPDGGGAFGAKGGLYPEYALVAALAWKLRRPVKWVETRSESFLATNHGRDQRQRVRAAFRRDGTLLGLDVEILSNLGAWNASPTRPTAVLTGLAIAGPYRVPALRLQVRCVVTNTTPQAAYRGAGRPEASYLLERLMDKAARELGLDPVTIRERNLLRPDDFPHRSPTGVPYDSGNYPAVLTEALRRFDYETARREQARLRAQGRMIGIGIASFCELSGPGWESATVRAHPDGTVTVLCGITPSGQGHATMLAQVVGEVLQLPLERIRVVTGDTVAVQQGIGTFGSRSTALGGSAAFLAAQEVLEKARAIAASALEVAPEDLEYRDGLFAVRGAPDRALPWERVTRLAYVMEGPPGNLEPGLEATRFFNPGRRNVPFGVHIAMVEVDPDTGSITILRYLAVDDSGRIVNPLSYTHLTLPTNREV